MPDRLDEADQLSLVRGHLEVASRERLAEESQWPRALVEHSAEAHP
jgi:hypothetical protein